MFRGLNLINIDDKGRMAMPVKYRERLRADCEEQLVLTIDTEDRCLLLYPLPAWEEIELKLEQLPSFDKLARRVQRLLIGHATEINLDNNGRLLLPQALRDYAGLYKKLVLIGQGKKFEIWDEAYWEEERKRWLEAEPDKNNNIPDKLKTLSL